MKRGIVLTTLLLGLLLGGCVSKKKYDEMENLRRKSQSLLADERKARKNAQLEAEDLKRQLADCEEARKSLGLDTARLLAREATMREEMGDLEKSCAQLDENYKRLKAKSSDKLRDMMNQLEGLQKDLQDREKRLAEVERKLNERDSIMNALQKRVSDALLGFQQDGLTVEVRNGKVYVSLSNKLLFASGSTKIDAKGKDALGELASVLKEQEDMSIMVEGHTDDVPVSNLGAIKDNWDLSVMRSTEVVRILVENGVQPTRIIPAGRSEYIPKAEGQSSEARAVNRRTEIVISPKLDELYELINKGS